MAKVFNSSGITREQMEWLYRQNLILCNDFEMEVATVPDWALSDVRLYLKKQISGAEVSDSILPSNKIEVSKKNYHDYPKLYECVCKGMDAREYILSHWSEYDIADTREEFVGILNILEAHDENLDSLHDVTVGNREWFCGICMNSNPTTDREVVRILYQFNVFYPEKDEALEKLKEDADYMEMSLDEYVNEEDIRSTLDGIVRTVYY